MYDPIVGRTACIRVCDTISDKESLMIGNDVNRY